MRLAILTAAALTGFAANSLLTRAAIAHGAIDAASFTAIRLLSGAVALGILARATRTPAAPVSWPSALALAGYAVLFSLAYVRIGAGIGALVLFASVQITMISAGLLSGERPGRLDWLGVALAAAGLLVLTLPGATRPSLAGAALMAGSGACWGIYSLRGRGSRYPLATTSANFLLASVAGLLFAGVSAGSLHADSRGVLLAATSGAVASGLGYTLWYMALPALAAWRAAILQLLVPVLTALGAAVILSETMSWRLAYATALVMSGVLLTVWSARRPQQ